MATPIVGVGPVTLGGSALSNLAEWTLSLPATLAEVKALADVSRRRLFVNATWTATVKFELPTIGRNLGAIAVGGWSGIEVDEWDFEATCDLKEWEGQADLWKRYEVQAPGAGPIPRTSGRPQTALRSSRLCGWRRSAARRQ